MSKWLFDKEPDEKEKKHNSLFVSLETPHHLTRSEILELEEIIKEDE